MNRKGDAPLILLVIVALALSVIALFVFLSHDSTERVRTVELGKFVQLDEDQRYIVASTTLIGGESVKQCLTCDSVTLKQSIIAKASTRDFGVKEAGNAFGKLRNGDFVVSVTGENVTLSFTKLFIQVQSDEGEFRRTFDLDLTFDKKGVPQSSELKGFAQG